MNNNLNSLNYFMSNRQSTILVVDDEPTNIQLIYSLFSNEHDVYMAKNASLALEVFINIVPDIILLDIMMPGMDGLAFCRLLKQRPDTKNIPVIFVTSMTTFEEESACWSAGCVDFVTKPVNPTTLLNRVRVHLALKFQAEYLQHIAYIDELTGVANRRAFDSQIHMNFSRAQRAGHKLALLIIDIDFFKQYNDDHGHLAGDDCLKKVSNALRYEIKRPADLIARFGGEEFICLLPDTGKDGAMIVAEKLRKTIPGLHIENVSSTVARVLTISIGIAVYPDTPCCSPEELIEAADKNLYLAKQTGRNKVCA